MQYIAIRIDKQKEKFLYNEVKSNRKKKGENERIIKRKKKDGWSWFTRAGIDLEYTNKNKTKTKK